MMRLPLRVAFAFAWAYCGASAGESYWYGTPLDLLPAAGLCALAWSRMMLHVEEVAA